MSSSTPPPPHPGLGRHRRYGFFAWFVFIVAIGAVLALAGGCLAVMYGPVLTGG
ncbi:MAG: hypothetical protein M0026_20955 [Nocardiopsaceae bacterium]|nr:hypothetical protein [Nocardiopsaceae bacterium]